MRDAAGDRLAVTAKFEMADGVPGGLWPGESIEPSDQPGLRVMGRRR